jgi:hypothetical protein
MPKDKPKTPFALALAARRGDVPPESLKGAAKRLYDDQSLTQAALEDYAKYKPVARPKQGLGKLHPTFKRS